MQSTAEKGLGMAQVFRTEVLSRKLPPKSTFKIMSVSLSAVAVLMGIAAAAAHPSEVVELVSNPGSHLKFLMSGLFPWGGVLYTGLLSTDLALLIEVLICPYLSSAAR